MSLKALLRKMVVAALFDVAPKSATAHHCLKSGQVVQCWLGPTKVVLAAAASGIAKKRVHHMTGQFSHEVGCETCAACTSCMYGHAADMPCSTATFNRASCVTAFRMCDMRAQRPSIGHKKGLDQFCDRVGHVLLLSASVVTRCAAKDRHVLFKHAPCERDPLRALAVD